MKPALSSTTLRSFPPGEIVLAAQRLGYGAAEIWAELLWDSGEGPAAVGKLARERGLALSVHGPSRDLNVTSLNEGVRRESRAQYLKSIEDAARMEAEIVVIHPGSLSSSHDRPEDFAAAMTEYAGELAGEAGRLGVRIALEVMESRPGEYVTGVPAAARIARGAAHPALGVSVDIAHLLYSGVPVEIEGFEPLITHVHLSGSTGERVHVPLAEGIYDLAAPLCAIGKFFGGIAAIESYAPGREMETAAENKKEFDRLMASEKPA